MADSKRDFDALLKRLAAPAHTAAWQNPPQLAADSLVDGRYRVVRLLGRGGMGEVYEVALGDGSACALKCLSLALAADRAARTRFEAEARAASSLGHRNIVRVLDSGTLSDGRPYLAMELVRGRSLGVAVHEHGALPIAGLIGIAIELCSALTAAHARGIVHRDLKPANVLLLDAPDAHGTRLKLGDFGVAKLLVQEAGTRLTTTGVTLGTPHYMAPEQVRGERTIDGRADLYALGVLLFYCATERLPFDAKSFAALAIQICSAEPPALHTLCPAAPPELAALVHRALRKEPAERFPDAPAMQDALRALLR